MRQRHRNYVFARHKSLGYEYPLFVGRTFLCGKKIVRHECLAYEFLLFVGRTFLCGKDTVIMISPGMNAWRSLRDSAKNENFLQAAHSCGAKKIARHECLAYRKYAT